ncbi:C-type lectin fold [Trinorchestia longiramus]|nr:C-type lectin fold [Trinorchestia longiramus]
MTIIDQSIERASTVQYYSGLSSGGMFRDLFKVWSSSGVNVCIQTAHTSSLRTFRFGTMTKLPWMTHALLCMVVAANTQPPNIHNIYSSKAGIYSTENRAVTNQSAAYHSAPSQSRCACRTMCASDVRCRAYWVLPQSTDWKCFLTEAGPFEQIPQPLDGAFYGYKKTDAEFFREDGMLYKMGERMETWTTAHQTCSRSKGYRLGIYKTLTQGQIIEEFFTPLYRNDEYACINVNLQENEQGWETWGDGTPYNQYESTSYFQVYNNDIQNNIFQLAFSQVYALHDRSLYTECYSVCQSDPFNFMLQ